MADEERLNEINIVNHLNAKKEALERDLLCELGLRRLVGYYRILLAIEQPQVFLSIFRTKLDIIDRI